jgi:PIN domain nuclease of toxin-antitoxin system
MLNLDTHIVLDMARGNLSAREQRLLRRAPLGISAIVLWEITKLYQRGRISLSLDDPGLLEIVESLEIWNITSQVCRETLRLDFESDPADELIAATSLARRVPLVTRDTRILKSRIVPFAI